MFEAARVGDSIVHTSALAGFIAGAIIGIAVVAAASFIVCSGGAGAFILGTLLSVGGSFLPSLGESIGKMFTSPKGKIIKGSKIVHTNKREAAFTGTVEGNPEGMKTAKGSEVMCSDHPSTPKPQVAEGSTLVFIDSRPAARKDDKIECGASIDEGSDNVHMGQDKYEYLPVQDEVPAWLRKAVEVAMFVAGFASGIAGAFRAGIKNVLPCLGKLAVTMGISYGVGKAVEYGGGKIVSALVGNPVDTTTGRKVLKPEDEIDFILPGYLPIVWSRFYASNLTYNSILGQGWLLPWEQYFYKENNILYYSDNQGRLIDLEPVKEGEKVYICSEQFFLICTEGNHYAIQMLDGQFYYFGEIPENGEKAYLQRIENKLGHYIQFSYEDDLLTDITATGGHRLHLHYRHPQAKLTEVVRVVDDKAVETMLQYRYNNAGQLIAVINRNGDTTRLFDYKEGLMTRHQNGLGFISEYRWQTIAEQPRVVEHWTNDGEHYDFYYDLQNRETVVTDALKRQARFGYDQHHQLTYCQEFGGDEYHLTYDENGNLSSYQLPNNNKLTFNYDKYSRLIEETDPLGRKVSYQYHHETNQQKKIIYPDGSAWQAEYDDKDCLVLQIDPLQNTTYYYNTEDGVPYAIVDPQQKRNTILWNHFAQVERYTDCSNKVTQYSYNQHLNLASITNALGETIQLERKPQGEITKLIHADGITETFTYNAMGQLLSHADGKGQTTYLSRNPRGLLTKRFDPKDQTIIYQYDTVQRLIALLNENNEAYRFTYDNSDRLIQETRIDQINRNFEYDEAGYLSKLTESGVNKELKTTSRATYLKRDKVGRLIAKTTEDASYSYHYDLLDKLIKLERKPTNKGKELGITEEILTFAYDIKGRLIQEQTPQGELNYLYDELDNLIALTLPNNRQINHQYYGSGHLHQISLDHLVISDFERDDLHREILRTQGNLTSRFGYDAQGRKHWQYASQKPLAELTTLNKQQLPIDRQLKSRENNIFRQYQYDAAGELSALLDKARGKTEYSYAQNGQLKTVITPNNQEYFSSDAAGNFLPSQVLSKQHFAVHNRITDYGDIHLEYDQWGNVVEKITGFNQYQKFNYDCENRLVKAQLYENNKLITESYYYYDSLGRRVKKQINNLRTQQNKQTIFLWQGLRLLQEQTEQKQITYIYEPNSYVPLARIDTEYDIDDIYYYHTDQIGTPLELTNQQGTIVWQANYKAWGEIESLRINEIDQSLRYQGQYFDEETELHYNTFRYYDPQVGRYITQDPIGLHGGFNLYAYAINPIAWIDPWGLCSSQQIATNKANGKAAEDLVLQRLNNNPDVTVLGTQVYVKTPGVGRGRYIDILIQDNKTGKLIGVEVKSGSATRSATQIAKDKVISSGSGVFGKNAPTDMNGIPLGGQNTSGVIVSETNVPLWKLP